MACLSGKGHGIKTEPLMFEINKSMFRSHLDMFIDVCGLPDPAVQAADADPSPLKLNQ